MKKYDKRKDGYALVMIAGIMAVLAVTFTTLVTNGRQSAYTATRMKNKVKAAAYAEAGIEFAYSVLADDYDNRTDPSVFRIDTSTNYVSGTPLESAYGDGSFILTLNNSISSNGEYVIINSLGKCGNSEIDVEVLIQDMNFTNSTTAPPPPNYDNYDVFKKAMASEGSAVFSGGGDLEAGSSEILIHSNDKIDIKGSIDVPCSVSSSVEVDTGNKNTDIAGDVTAPTISGKGSVDGDSTEEAVPPISIPAVDMEPFRLHAVNNGAYVEGSTSLSSDPPGGIWYVNGNVTVPPGATINGTIIATGNIDVKGDVIETHGIAVGTLGGNITYNSQATSVGMVYTQSGEFSQTGGGSSGLITGQIIAGGGAFKAGGGDLNFGVYLPETPEDGISDPDSSGADPQIAAWQK